MREKNMDYPLWCQVRAGLIDALRRLYLNDAYLVHIKAHERSITFRLGMYLQQIFTSWNVDCEYNRNFYTGNNSKMISISLDCQKHYNCNVCEKKCNGCTVFPDIIIHRRRTENNLLIIEAKTNKHLESDEVKKDIVKIEQYVADNVLAYKYGLFINFANSACNTLHGLRWCWKEDSEGTPCWHNNCGEKIETPTK